MYWHGRGEGEIDNDNEGAGGVAARVWMMMKELWQC